MTLPFTRFLLPLSISLLLQGETVLAESLAAYGEQLCEDAGIPREQCSLIPQEGGVVSPTNPGVNPSSDTTGPDEITLESDKSSKTETVVEHARQLCAKQGVRAEDCMALPSDLRTSEIAMPPAGKPTTSSAAKVQVRHSAPPTYRYLPPITDDQQQLAVEQDRPLASPPNGTRKPAQIQAQPAPNPRPPLEATARAARFSSPPRDPAFLADRNLDPMIDRGIPEPQEAFETVGRERQPRFDRRFDRREEDLRDLDQVENRRITRRCFRSVRFSPPPSYRFVACDTLD